MGKKKEKLPAEQPTPEQAAAFQIESITDRRPGGGSIVIGTAYRRRPMIDVLNEQGLFSTAEYKALKHYRHHADLADRSPLRDSVASLMRVTGSGDPPGVELLNATRVRDDCERAAGSLQDILRAVVVDDMSLSQWAIRRSGAIEVAHIRRGKRVVQMEPRRKALDIARLDIVMAAKRVQAELDA